MLTVFSKQGGAFALSGLFRPGLYGTTRKPRQHGLEEPGVVDMVMRPDGIGARSRERVRAHATSLALPASLATPGVMGIRRLVSSDGVSPKNKELILRFLGHISAEVSERRLTFYTHKLRKLAGWLGKDFDAATEEDLRTLVTFLSRGPARECGRRFSQGTVHGYKVTLKRFYRWLEANDEGYPRKVQWIKTNGDTARIREPEQLLTAEEVLAMIRHANTPRDKAMVSFLYESGARVGEILSMRVRHLEFTPTVVRATLPTSKTQPRVLPLISCARHLATWLNYHPRKDDPQAPLWSNLKRDGRSSLIPQTVNAIVREIALRAGVRKHVYPHLFRACSITHKHRQGWPEQAIKAFHGLSKDSTVMKHYMHLSYGDLEQIQKQMHGLAEEKATELAGGVECSGCGRRNPLYIDRCVCGVPTEMTVPSQADRRRSLEAEVAAHVDRRMQELVESRRADDRLMESFMAALVGKCRESAEFRRMIGEVSAGMADRGRRHHVTPAG